MPINRPDMTSDEFEVRKAFLAEMNHIKEQENARPSGNSVPEKTQENVPLQSGGSPKNSFLFYFSGLFAGICGIHNFYAGYKKRAFIQLGLFLLPFIASLCYFLSQPFDFLRIFKENPLFVLLTPTLIYFWNIFEIVLVKTDAHGTPFSPPFTKTLGIFMLSATLPLSFIGFIWEVKASLFVFMGVFNLARLFFG